MINFMLSNFSMVMNFIFMQMKHPLAMGMILLLQTFLICLISGNFTKTFWFSYILFLVFLGGMLVLFIYVTSLASNEMFTLSKKMMMLMFISFLLILLMIYFLNMKKMNLSNLMNNEMNMMNMNFMINENSMNLNKLYNFPTNMITLILINYLFLTLVAVVKVTNIFYGPLRPK